MLMDYTRYKPDFDRDGFVVVRQFLPPDELAEVTENLDRYITEVVPSLPDKDAFYQDRQRPETLKQLQHMGCDQYFSDFRSNPRFASLAHALLGEPANAQEPEWFNKPPGVEHPTPPHQDNYYFCLKPPSVVTIWVALDPVDEGNGCLRYVRGSYRDGIRPHSATDVLGFSQGITDYGATDQEREVVIRAKPGDAVVHHGETIHRADPNQSTDRHRRAFAMVLKGESCQVDDAAFRRYDRSRKQQHQGMGLETK